MAKQVQVRYTGPASCAVGNEVCRDCSVGTVYSAYLPEAGEWDKDGLRVQYDDELWIIADDAGDGVVCRLADGFELAV
ncbi:hypothetical protein [Enterobacter phage SDFMU_EhYP]|uniref:Uncharacterized protein n=1 Tax=Enterobacter phage SDFMU_EhYP TaxID=3076128 RepID=A0AA96KRM1_9CAUD|nr:hypothetical protein [Enterobacter phage SDFMU_EhYP]